MIHSLKRTPLAAGILLALNSPLYSPPALAAPGDPVGVEFQVNTFTDDTQNAPSIAMDADGDFVIAWQSRGQDGDKHGVYAQRYQADGTAAGVEFQVNTETTARQINPSIAMDEDGDFVITWASYYQDGSNYGVYAQRYQADGTAAGGEFQVNTETNGVQNKPSIALDADGDFMIAWRSLDSSVWGIYAQRYQADGVAVGGEFQVNTETNGGQIRPNIAMDADGDSVIVWASNLQDGSDYGIYAQRYQADGTAAGGEFQVNTFTSGRQDVPSVAMDADGDFVIAWSSLDGDGNGIYAQRYQADGTAAGEQFRVNTETKENQLNSSIGLDADGNFVIAWSSEIQDGNARGIFAQRYQADGTATGGEFQVNTETNDNQFDSSIALDADGDFVIAWSSEGSQDGDGSGVYAQRYEGASSSGVDLSVVLQDDTDPVEVGSSFVYSLIITNNGTESATDVILSDPMPPGISYVSYDASTADWSCALSGTTINCNKALMTDGEQNTINLTFTADTIGTVSNTVTVTATQTDADNSDNTDTETTTVIVNDTAAPLITLLGSNPISVTQNTVFTDPGVTITDNVDIGLVATVTGSVDTATAGSYTLSYNVTDNAGNTAIEVQRTVIVVDATMPVIALLGDNLISVTQNTVFTDPGVTITDNVDTGLVATVTGSVDTATAGSYTLSYNITDSAGNAAIEVQRTVIVVDTTIPAITLLGDNSISVTQNTAFTDPGVTITDNVDTGLVATVTGSVDTATAGSYTLSYNVTDSAGNAAIEVQRTVIVAETSGSGGSFGITSLLLVLSLCLRRRRHG